MILYHILNLSFLLTCDFNTDFYYWNGFNVLLNRKIELIAYEYNCIKFKSYYTLFHNNSKFWFVMDKRFQITELIVEKHRVNAAKDRTCVKLHLCQFLFSCMMFIFLDLFQELYYLLYACFCCNLYPHTKCNSTFINLLTKKLNMFIEFC